MEKYTQEVLAEGDLIFQLIPHRAPFVMVDKLHYTDEVRTISSFTARKENLFFENGKLHEPALVENIAQTAALRMGYAGLQELLKHPGATPPLGFIGGITDLKIFHLPSENEIILTEIVFEREVMDVILIKGSSQANGIKLAECEMKLYIKRN